MTVTAEGLRIELLESEKGTFFDSGRPEPNASGREMLITLANELGKVPNKLSMEGHTDAQPYAGRANYSNWELSADRANASRRLMQQNGLRDDQVVEVRGFADQRLQKPQEPDRCRQPKDFADRALHRAEASGSPRRMLTRRRGQEALEQPRRQLVMLFGDGR